MQKSPPNPQFNELLAALPKSEAALLERARALQAQGDVDGAAELLGRANDRCPTPAINAAQQALQRQNAESDADPVTQELDELEVTTLESQSLELNAFERPDELDVLDDSDIFAGSSFDSLSSLEPADDSPNYAEDQHVETDEMQQKNIAAGANDESVNELLVDLGLPVAAQDEDDYNATRTIVGRIDDALGIQRDDLLADDSEIAQRDFYAAPEFDAEPLNAADYLDPDEDILLEQDTAPRTASPISSSPDAFGEDDLEWDDVREDEWDDVADTQFQMQMPLNPPVATPALSKPE